MKKEECFYIGKITGKYSFRGELLVKTDSDNPKQYTKLKSIFIELDSGLVPFMIKNIQLHKSELIRIQFDNILNEMEANKLIKKDVYLPLSFLPKLKGKKFYYHEVIGFSIMHNNENLGAIERIHDQGLQALFEIKKNNGSTSLIPIHDDFIINVDRVKKNISVEIPDGLLEL